MLWGSPQMESPQLASLGASHGGATRCSPWWTFRHQAMASEGPDPLAFKTWEDAFQYPIPTVRKLELQLRNHGEDNRHKLRNLVGYVKWCSSYDLPG
jgi:hypothetical protein